MQKYSAFLLFFLSAMNYPPLSTEPNMVALILKITAICGSGKVCLGLNPVSAIY